MKVKLSFLPSAAFLCLSSLALAGPGSAKEADFYPACNVSGLYSRAITLMGLDADAESRGFESDVMDEAFQDWQRQDPMRGNDYLCSMISDERVFTYIQLVPNPPQTR